MRTAAVVALFVVVFAAFLFGVVAPASGQTIPPPNECFPRCLLPTSTPLEPQPTPLTPYPTVPGCIVQGCHVPTPTPIETVPTPGTTPIPPLSPAMPGLPIGDFLVFVPTVRR